MKDSLDAMKKRQERELDLFDLAKALSTPLFF